MREDSSLHTRKLVVNIRYIWCILFVTLKSIYASAHVLHHTLCLVFDINLKSRKIIFVYITFVRVFSSLEFRTCSLEFRTWIPNLVKMQTTRNDKKLFLKEVLSQSMSFKRGLDGVFTLQLAFDSFWGSDFYSGYHNQLCHGTVTYKLA